jgi:hypothetical protein
MSADPEYNRGNGRKDKKQGGDLKKALVHGSRPKIYPARPVIHGKIR